MYIPVMLRPLGRPPKLIPRAWIFRTRQIGSPPWERRISLGLGGTRRRSRFCRSELPSVELHASLGRTPVAPFPPPPASCIGTFLSSLAKPNWGKAPPQPSPLVLHSRPWLQG